MAKELSKQEKIEYAEKNGISIDEIERESPGLLHGKIAAYIGKKEFGYTEDMLQAISYHTTACEKMNMLTKILFVADACSVDRNHPGVERIYNLAKENLDEAVLDCLNYAIKENLEKGKLLHPNSVYARNYLIIEHKKSIK